MENIEGFLEENRIAIESALRKMANSSGNKKAKEQMLDFFMMNGFLQKLKEIKATKLAVIGSRIFDDENRVKETLNRIISITEIDTIVSGGASGVDTFAENFATENNLKTIIHKPEKYTDKGMDFPTNQNIIDECDAVLAYIKGESKGTRNSVELTKKQGKPFHIIEIKN